MVEKQKAKTAYEVWADVVARAFGDAQAELLPFIARLLWENLPK